MMNYEIFKEVVKEKFMDYMPEKFKGMELVAEPVEKVNVTLDGIILREEGRNISPTIYINDMYKKYQDCGDLEETLMAACDFMERAYEQAPDVDVDSIMRDANEKIVFQLINTEQNKTFLEQVPHREFQDLSIVYKVIISADKDAVQSSKITNEFAKRLGMSEEQLFKCAAENTRRLFPPVVRSMNDIMKEMFARDGMPQEIAEMMIAEIPPEQTMWVISNEKGINGAASMLYENELHELAESLESDLYILPSSVHEVIAVSSDMGSPEMLAQMVVDIIWKIIAYRNINLHSLCTKYAFIARSIILLILSSRKLRFFILRKTLCFNVFNASLCFSCKKILLRAEKVKYYKMLVDIKEK